MPAPPRCLTATPVGVLPFTHGQNTESLDASPDDPDPSCTGIFTPSNTAWYLFTAPSTGRFVIDTRASSYDTIIQVHTGPCDTLVEIACDDENNLVGFDATNGVEYRIMIGAKTSDGGALSVTFLGAVSPDPPILSIDALTSISIRLKWEATIEAPGQVRIERCTGTGCTSWALQGFVDGITDQAGRTFRQSVASGTTYRYRAYVEDSVRGDSAPSGPIEITIPTGTTGLTQYKGSVGTVSSLAESTVNAARGAIAIMGSGVIRLIAIEMQDTPGSNCHATDVHVRHSEIDGTEITNSALGAGPHTQELVGSDVLTCQTSQSLEMKFALGHTDEIMGKHLNTGYYEVKLNGSVILRVENLAIGLDGVSGWIGVSVSPFGWLDDAGTLAGLQSFYSNSVDEYGPGRGGPDHRQNIIENYSVMSDVQMWKDIRPANPWSRFNDLGNPSTDLPKVVSGGIGGNNVVASNSFMMRFFGPTVFETECVGDDCPEPPGCDCPPCDCTCGCKPPCEGPDCDSPGDRTPRDPVRFPEFHGVCEGGGVYLSAPDPIYAENWRENMGLDLIGEL